MPSRCRAWHVYRGLRIRKQNIETWLFNPTAHSPAQDSSEQLRTACNLPAPAGTPADVPDWGIPAHCDAWWTGMSPEPTYKMPSVVEVTKGTRVQGTPESLPVLKSPGLLVPPARITHNLLELLATASIFFCPTLPSLQTTSASALASPQYLERSYLSALPAKVEACADPPSPENAHQYSTKGKSRV